MDITWFCLCLEAADSLIANLIHQSVLRVRKQVKDKAVMNYAETWVCLSAASGVKVMAVKDWLNPWSHQAGLGSGAGIVGHTVDAQVLMIFGTCYIFPLSAVVPVRSVFLVTARVS